MDRPDLMFYHHRGISIQQNEHVVHPFRAMIRDVRPARVIEIGSASGGLTLLVRGLLDEAGLPESVVYSFDINPVADVRIAPVGIQFRQTDVFQTNDVEYLLETTDGPCVLLCDGGNKPREFQTYAPHLRSGDLILAHDYAPDWDYFEREMQGKRWNWCEIQGHDIATACQLYDLVPYEQDAFQRVAWCARRKA